MAEPTKSIRAFIAINLAAELKAALEKVQRELKSSVGGRAVRWTPVEQVHLTLRFLGDVPAAAVPDIQSALRRACVGAAPFELRLGGLGCFPDTRRPRVVWVGVLGDLDHLRQLQKNVERETAPWGEREEREFHPHLTIGRVKEPGTGATRQIADALSATAAGSPASWRVAQLDLMQSRLSPAGAEHASLTAIPLSGVSAGKD